MTPRMIKELSCDEYFSSASIMYICISPKNWCHNSSTCALENRIKLMISGGENYLRRRKKNYIQFVYWCNNDNLLE